MKEELIRVEHGDFQHRGQRYQFELDISRGECIGVYVDDHLTSGTAYLGIFEGRTHFRQGRAFLGGCRVNGQVLEQKIWQMTMVVDKNRFGSGELTVRDFLVALGKPADRGAARAAEKRLETPAAASLLGYYRLWVLRAWLWEYRLVILDRITEVLRQRDREELMQCVRLLLELGTAVIVLDLDEAFMCRCADRIDVVKNKRTCYRLYPDEYGERLYEILGWKCPGGGMRQTEPYHGGDVVLRTSGLTFPGMPPLEFQIRSGEIACLRDENYSTAVRLRSCFLGQQAWLEGTFWLDGAERTHGEVARMVGTEIGLQLERPDRTSGCLFDDLTALDNLSICLLAKANKRLATRRVTENILHEASGWFPRQELQKPLRTWPLPQRLRFSYYKWYVLNPKLLVCFFPFAGQETAHHTMIVDMLAACAARGMAVWVISSGIDAICEKAENREFLRRLRYLN